MGALSTTLLAAVLLAQPGLAPETVVTVQRIGQDGVTYPLVGAEVAVETWKQVVGPGASRQLDAVRHVRTDLAGAARFVGVSSERTLESVATVVYDGVTYVSDPIAKAAVTMTVYESTGDQGALRGRMSVGLDVRDGFVIVDTSLALTNRSRQVIDTRRTPQGFRMPVALPAVLGGPWEIGVIPSDTGPRHVSTRATPERGRFQFRDGAVFFEGPIPPGSPTTLQARYALPIVAERQDVALTTPVPLDQLMISTSWTDRVAPRVVPDREFLAVGREPGESVQRFLRIERPPAPGEAFVVHVDRLPRPDAVRNQLAVGGGVALLVVFGLSLVALRRRDD